MEYFQLKKFEEQKMQEVFSDLSISAEARFEILMWEMSSPFPEERTILISQDRGTVRGIWRSSLAVSPVFYL